MKKVYDTPSAEKIAFRYRDQVVAASGGTHCSQDWTGLASSATSGCTYNVVIQDSGM